MSVLHQLSSTSKPPSEDLASVSVVRYLDATDLGVVPEAPRSQWKWMASVLISGALLGFGLNFCLEVNAAAVPQHLARVSIPNLSQTVVPVPYSSDRSNVSVPLTHSKQLASASELEEIKTRNRRLEALVKVLRQRTVDKHRNAAGGGPG